MKHKCRFCRQPGKMVEIEFDNGDIEHVCKNCVMIIGFIAGQVKVTGKSVKVKP